MTMNGKTIPLPSELTTPPVWTSQTERGSFGSRLRRYEATGLTENGDYATHRGARGPRRHLPARRDVCDLARFHRRDGVGDRRGSACGEDRLWGGRSDRPLRRERRLGGGLPE